MTTTIEKMAILDPERLYEIMQAILHRENKIDPGQEHLWALSLGSDNRLLNLELVTMGREAINEIKPMEVLALALRKEAAGIILVHNQPTAGKLAPTEADKDLTNRLIQACALMRTPLLDHVIITETHHYSFADDGLLAELEASEKYVLSYELKERYEKALKDEEQQLKQRTDEAFNKRMGAVAQSMLAEGIPIEQVCRWTGMREAMITQKK